MINNTLTIILAGGEGSRLQPLTRVVPSLRFRLAASTVLSTSP